MYYREMFVLLLCVGLQKFVEVAGESCADGTLKVVVRLESELDKFFILHERLNFTLQSLVGQKTSVFFTTCNHADADIKIANLLQLLGKKVQIVRKEWIHHEPRTLPPVHTVRTELIPVHRESRTLPPTNRVCEDYYGFGVEDVWARSYSGKNVTVAILDVGVNVDLEDLKHNIDIRRSYNFLLNNTDVKPEYYYTLSTSVSPMTDHGNQICSIVAATKGNNLCSAGIAYNATIIVRKMFNVIKLYGGQFSLYPSHWTSSSIFSRAILQNSSDVSIMIMAWAPVSKQYDNLDSSTYFAIKKTASEGRNGRGTLLFVPSGPVGNGLANNVYTITVGGMRRFGEIPVNSFADASVITSGLTEGSNLTSLKMVTTTLRNRCASVFKGVSAATAQVAAIAALVLEANPSLSMRDVKHILVQASDYTGLMESRSFKQNGAGHYFHGILGFGLLNAFEAVILAEIWKPVPKLFSKTFTNFHKSSPSNNLLMFKFNNTCVLKQSCLTKVEEVEVNTSLPSISEIYAIEVVSPSGTKSVLLDPALGDQSLEQIVHPQSTDVLLSSVHLWDETAIGDWKVVIQFKHVSKVPIDVHSVMLTIYGTGQGTVDEEVSTNIPAEVQTKKPQKKSSGNMVAVNYLLVTVVVMLYSLVTSVICAG